MTIWTEKFLSLNTSPSNQISIREGSTPLDWIILDEKKVHIKREDMNPTGSFKDRSMAYMFSVYKDQGIKSFSISSSGNAAISAINFAQQTSSTLDIFVSPKTSIKKIKKLKHLRGKDKSINIHISLKAKSDSIAFANQNNCINLRGSTDDNALNGYKSIAYELYEQNPHIDAIFVPVSSGTGALGIYEGYLDLNLSVIPQIHIVQNQRIHPIAKEFDNNFVANQFSISDCITDKVAKRKQFIIDAVKKSKGFGWVVSDEEIQNATKKVSKIGIEFPSFNSNLSTAGYLKSIANGHTFQNPCLIFSGL